FDAASGIGLGRMSLGIFNTEPQPFSNADGSLIAVMDGELYDGEQERQRLKARGHVFQGASHIELLLAGFEHEERAFLARLQGCFVAAIWNRKERRLTVLNDRLGMRHVYYAQAPGRLLFASEIKALLADREVTLTRDLRGIAQFFTYGHLLGQTTFF